jgi:CheY-like chemotaxis protein
VNAAEQKGDLRGLRLMLVDDAPDVLRAATELLSSCGVRVSAFLDPREAWGAFESTPTEFDAVLTDFHMPHLNGGELAQLVHSVSPDVPIIVWTGSQRDEIEKYEDSVAAVIDKTTRTDAIRDLLSRLTGSGSR